MTSESASAISHDPEPRQTVPAEAAQTATKGKGLDIASQLETVKQAEPDLTSGAPLDLTGGMGETSASVRRTLDVIDAIESALRDKREEIERIQARQQALAQEFRQLGQSLETATKDLADQFMDIIADLETAEAPMDTPADPPAAPPADPQVNTQAQSQAQSLAQSQDQSQDQAQSPAQSDAPSDPSSAGSRALTPAVDPEAAAQAKAEPEMTELKLETEDLGSQAAAQPERFEQSPEPADTSERSRMSKPDSEGEEISDLDLEISNMPPVPEFLGRGDVASDKKDEDDDRDSGSISRPWWKQGRK